MIWVIVIFIIGYILIKYFLALNKDNNDLQGKTLDDKFHFIVDEINESAFNGNGHVTYIDKREFNLYEVGQNQIVKFHYSSGHLSIIWKYKYFQKEVILERQFNDVRNLSIFDQQRIAKAMITEMTIVVENHKANVLNDI
ncbi:hypothetical protein AQPE_2013 [Aquipluma nitroreducens]|uniref:Uncharacterized protein n=1 Tax=Aquipluma nitroreducens TaxID=2010828 RepID=A0A5K7S958_9BACT|nr:hypothetical protein [Aquipluma nitroreducens]BBE17854.1 hypothetical protein AQPE_2013 [Aquipluma nitroreducens]